MLFNQDWEQSNNPVSRLLSRAADLMEQFGLAKFVRKDSNGSMCYLGALEEANGGMFSADVYNPLVVEASKRIQKALDLTPAGYRGYHGPETVYPVVAVVDWNNAPERTKEEVVEAMRQAAKVKETADAI
jgi:hypothetical protein